MIWPTWRQICDGFLIPLVGLVVLLPACLLQAWEPTTSTQGPYPAHPIDQWSWVWLRPWFNNPEDGVSGQFAMVWPNGTARVPYRPGISGRTGWRLWLEDALRAYLWSAWRNTADNRKYA